MSSGSSSLSIRIGTRVRSRMDLASRAAVRRAAGVRTMQAPAHPRERGRSSGVRRPGASSARDSRPLPWSGFRAVIEVAQGRQNREILQSLSPAGGKVPVGIGHGSGKRPRNRSLPTDLARLARCVAGHLAAHPVQRFHGRLSITFHQHKGQSEPGPRIGPRLSTICESCSGAPRVRPARTRGAMARRTVARGVIVVVVQHGGGRRRSQLCVDFLARHPRPIARRVRSAR